MSWTNLQREIEHIIEDAKRLSCVDLFAGAGGFSLAAAQSGFVVRLAIENDRHAALTLSKNITHFQHEPCRVLDQCITKLSATELSEELFGGDNTCDVVLGGPPCQGFSTHRIKDAGVDDERNKLVKNYFEFVKALRPKIFLMENVPGMLWDRHKKYVDSFYGDGAKASYKIHNPVVLDARDYGVPQRRKRVFILGVAADVADDNLVWPPKQTHGSEADCARNPELEPWMDCNEAFLPARPDDPNDIHMKHSDELVLAFKNTPHNGGSRRDSGRVLPCHRNHDGHKDVYGRIDPSKPAPTMTTACVNPSKGRFVHPTENHGLTVRQAARIQTFPDNIIFEGGLMAAGKQIGNAVPVELGKKLLAHIHVFLEMQSWSTLGNEITCKIAAE